MISIQFPVIWGRNLRDVLESIRSQSYQNYEIVVTNGTSNIEITEILREYDVVEIKTKANLLSSRYLANFYSKGTHALILNETRKLSKGLLNQLATMSNDVIIIRESEIGVNIWSKLSNIDFANSLSCKSFSPEKGYVIPRYFRRSILDASITEVRKNLGEKIFQNILFNDDYLIWYETYKITNDIGVIREPMIHHYGDENYFQIFKKYYRYGMYNNLLRGTKYEWMLKFSHRRRDYCHGNKILLTLNQLARGIPFIIGYQIGKVSKLPNL